MPQQDAPPAGPEGRFSKPEQGRGAPHGGDAGEAGEAMPKAKPTDDRALTESAAARTEAEPSDSKPDDARPSDSEPSAERKPG